MKYKGISVVICTHNRKEHLLESISSFKRIQKPKFELVVIDSSDKKLTAKEKKGIGVYIYDKAKKPLSDKRNIAVKICKSEIIAFTDDDCIATSSWLYELTYPFNDEDVMCVTGKTVPFKGYKKSDYERIFSFDNLGKNKRVIKKHLGLQNLWRFGHGNNMAFRNSVFKKIGLFDEGIGIGTEGKAGEDVDIFYRIYKKGYKLVFNPNAVILHKHIFKQDLTKWAQNNTYASHLILLKHHDLNTLTIFLLGVFKLAGESTVALFTGDALKSKIKFYSLFGWVGIKCKR